VAVACSLVFVLATAGTAIPLYNTYRTQDGITNADLGWCSVAYFVSAATSLLVLGQLSNPLGSRLVAIAVLASETIRLMRNP
jgi:hypothetical protein